MKSIRILSKENILALHCLIADVTGGGEGVRDMGLLESALSAPYQSFGGLELYPTLTEKAARLGFSLVSNHAFIDGNKRIGILSMLTFLKLNGCPVKCTDAQLTELGLGLAAGEISYGELLDFLNSHIA